MSGLDVLRCPLGALHHEGEGCRGNDPTDEEEDEEGGDTAT